MLLGEQETQGQHELIKKSSLYNYMVNDLPALAVWYALELL